MSARNKRKPSLKNPANKKAAPVVIVGGGLAGLGAARVLTQSGYKVELFEGNPDRLGGRVESGKFVDALGVEQKYELGGEFIDVGHGEMRQLVKQLGLTLRNIYQATQGLSRIFKVQDPSRPDADADGFVTYTEEQFTKDYKGRPNLRDDEDGLPYSPWWKIHKDSVAAGYPTHWDEPNTPRGRQLANTTIDEYLDFISKGLETDYMKQVLQALYTIEFGWKTYTDPGEGDPDTDASRRRGQSALNFIYLISYAGPGKVRVFGQNAEKYSVAEGMSAVIDAMEAEIVAGGSVIHMGQRLEKLTRATVKNESNKNVPGWHLEFRDVTSNSVYIIEAERVINAIPMALMRKYRPAPAALDPTKAEYLDTQAGEPGVANDGNEKFDWNVNVADAQFSSRKRRAILKLKAAEITKIMIQYHNRPWYNVNGNGDSVASNKVKPSDIEEWYQNTWDSTAGDPGTDGILTVFTGGDNSRRYGSTGPGSLGQNDTNDPVGIYLQIQDLIDRRIPTAFPGSNGDHYITRVNGKITNKFAMRNWSDFEYSRSAWSVWDTGCEAWNFEGTDNAFTSSEREPEPVWQNAAETIPTPLEQRNCWFASEAVTDEYQGYMNGALVGGIWAASAVLSAFKAARLQPNLL